MYSWNCDLDECFSLDEADPNTDFPEPVREWLSNVYLMNEIPLSYMVPDKNMLPPESIRFFIMDRNWLKSLTDGAVSIGRDTSRDVLIDNAALHGIYGNSYQQTPLSRQSLMHKNHRRDTVKNELTPQDKLSGFIMNSVIVKYFTGLEVKGTDGNKELQILRLDVLSERMILCIFDGIVKSVTFQEPSEALRYGTKDIGRTIPVRKITGDNVGEHYGGSVTLKTADNGRVDIKAMAKDLADSFQIQEGEITSRELALHLICVADKCEINVK